MARNDSRHAAAHGERGFSLTEIMIVLCLIAVVSAMAVPVSSEFLNQRKADSGVVAAMSAVTAARDRAIAERRNIQFTFLPPNKIELSRVEVPSGTLSLVDTFTLDNGQIFIRFAEAGDTPDKFGGELPQSFSGTAPIMFTSDGSLIDSQGDIVNGTIFLGQQDQIDTARAITIYGVTGLTKAWKWRGTKWMQ